MSRALLISALFLTAHVAAARGIASKELVGTWIMGASGADNVYGKFRSDLTYSISHGERPWAHGTWKLLDHGKKLEMTDSDSRSGDITIIRRFDGRLLHVTISNGLEGAWEKIRRDSKHGSTQT